MAEYGGYAEAVVVPQQSAYLLPDSLPFTAAGAMSLAFDTAWVSLRERARLVPGESVLVLGANGAVGSAAVQLGVAMGASPVLAGVSSPERYADLDHLGAGGMVDLSRPGLRDSVREQVFALTDGRGVDVVVDPLGGDPFDGAVRALAWRGRLVVVGFASGRIPTLAANYLLLKNIEVSGIQISDYRKKTPELLEECYRDVFSLYVAGKVVAPAIVRYPLESWQAAVSDFASHRAKGRVLLVPDGED
jgi:NADPH2:quinone reductase